MARPRILILEDERKPAGSLAPILREEGFHVTVGSRGDGSHHKVVDGSFELVLLDLMLPSAEERAVCRELRWRSNVPILLLTASGREVDKVLGLETGADDYLAKPFGVPELVARIKALLRRTQPPAASPDEEVIHAGRLVMNVSQYTVSKDGLPLTLRPKEFQLLRVLLANAGRVVKRDRLQREVWGTALPADRGTLDVHIRWLREKIEDDPSQPRCIVTVRGVGYRLLEED
jgi:two-component system, OmpR family, response regulator RegX3